MSPNETNRIKLERIETAMVLLSKEVGVLQGELKWVKWLMGASTAAIFGQLLLNIFGG